MTITVHIEHTSLHNVAEITGGQLGTNIVELKPGESIDLSLWKESPPILISYTTKNDR